ncbi:endolytic transglycosylase MltG [Bacillus changyiensis]|uniref:endolytic transglycosylase MltG n=1 Tax=Bacillus changyiensis TaxID=3004103 RepID=UPI0022E20967|nr:endolytic transglycosylase MltG [Bacillus changyiensis]MDA1474836.1 endolytic transglycosylase MltG [Bacillus changyiensis]
MNRQSVQAFAGGMILATGVLAGAFYLTGNGNAESKDAEKVSESNVKTYLKNNEQIAVEKNEYQELLQYKETALKQGKVAQKDNNKAEDKNKDKDKNKDNDKKEDKDKKKKDTKYKLEIKSGMSLSEVADTLAKEKVVSSADKFEKYAKKSGYESKLRAGKYELKRGESFKKIVETLSK